MSVSKKRVKTNMFKQNHTEQTRKSISLTMKGQLGHLHTEISLKPARWYTEETKAKLWLAMHYFLSASFF